MTVFHENMTMAADVLREKGLLVEAIIPDGTIQRCPTLDKPRKRNGAYIFFPDAPQVLWWQNFATGESGTWKGKFSKNTSLQEQSAVQRKRAEEIKDAYSQAAKKAQRIYAEAQDCFEHTYLKKKGVQFIHGLKFQPYGKYNALICPLFDASRTIVSLQFIEADGTKRFLLGGKTKGCFFPISIENILCEYHPPHQDVSLGVQVGQGSQEKTRMAPNSEKNSPRQFQSYQPLLICEGLATGLSLYEATSYPVLVAFNAGNLLSVAKIARGMFPQRKIILCADNDIKKDSLKNVGVDAAYEAALAVEGFIAVPNAGNGDSCDWNDLHQHKGQEEVWRQFKQAEKAFSKDIREMPEGFSLRTEGPLPGLWHTETKKEGSPVETWIGPPLRVLGATRDEKGSSWGLLLEWRDPDGRKHSWAMPRALLENRDPGVWRGRLADEGWSGAPGSKAKALLARYLASYKSNRRILCVSSMGWHYGIFVFPDAVIAPPAEHRNKPVTQPSFEGEQIVLQSQSSHNPFQVSGSLEEWQASIGQWARGNSRLILVLCASLAAPLLAIAGQESGGFNLVGQSSSGKTTGLAAGGSVWGSGTSSGGYLRSWRATTNGLEGLAALHSDTPLFLDEISQAPGRTLMEASYMLANGIGKSRALADGSAGTGKSWRCMIISTGEKALSEKIAEEGGRVQAGQAVRLIDVPADAGAGLGLFEALHGHSTAQEFSEAIKRAAATHYGHLARQFITQFQANRTKTEEALYQALTHGLGHLCSADADGQVKRAAKRFLLCALAGEMAAEWKLLPWNQGEALQAVKTCFDAWIECRGGLEAAEDTTVLEQVMLFIEQHGASRFQDVENHDSVCINRVGFRRRLGTETEYMVLPESFRTEVCKGVSYKKAIAVLSEKGLLIPGEGKNKARKPDCLLPGFGYNKRCYTLRIPSVGEVGEHGTAPPAFRQF